MQCGGDASNNRLGLAGRQRSTTVEIRLPYLHRHEVRTPLSNTARLLAAFEADYHPYTSIRAVVDALSGVLTASGHHKREGHTGVPLVQIGRAIAYARTCGGHVPLTAPPHMSSARTRRR